MKPPIPRNRTQWITWSAKLTHSYLKAWLRNCQTVLAKWVQIPLNKRLRFQDAQYRVCSFLQEPAAYSK